MQFIGAIGDQMVRVAWHMSRWQGVGITHQDQQLPASSTMCRTAFCCMTKGRYMLIILCRLEWSLHETIRPAAEASEGLLAPSSGNIGLEMEHP